ncbi:DUF6221 family protein [[Kitasatospora] papulosa]|jgi:hypothetical protein|uniref:DUF6221 family protein n=1 Tax=[Kitasatospora] papulosa TaxID=1464011 RepID=UPI003689F60A
MTDTLVAFLKARLDDDERVARACAGDGTWTVEGLEIYGSDLSGEVRAHAAHQDPARTLREVEAARAVLDLYEEAGDRMDRAMNDSDTVAYQEARIEQRTLRKVLLRNAAVHEAHPDYLQEWHP